MTLNSPMAKSKTPLRPLREALRMGSRGDRREVMGGGNADTTGFAVDPDPDPDTDPDSIFLSLSSLSSVLCGYFP
ncbi:MAG TPA: hypothetical protein DEW46_09865, partial [Verrucomicrobia bacterium]|nr:hypothetical protein [Verrucomicrobiota bacterium]